MKRAILLIVLLASGVLFTSVQASAQSGPSATPTAPEAQASEASTSSAPDFLAGGANIQVQTYGGSTESSKFNEYRDIPKGVTLPAFRLFGVQQGVTFDLRGENARQLDERYIASLSGGWFGVTADYNAIIHNLGNGGRTMLSEQSPGVWRMSDALQLAFQNNFESTPTASRNFITYITPLFAPSIAEGNVVDISVQRLRSNIGVDLAKNKPFSAKVSYTREQRHGSGGLSGNNINYVVETPSVTEYLTEDYGFNAAVSQAWGSVRGAFHYNTFTDQVSALRFDNPLRASDLLAGNVTLPGGVASVGGATSGLVVMPPDNSAYTGAFGTTIKLPAHTRITADVTLGRMLQNAQLFPFATSTAIVSPVVASSTASLPVQSLNGEIATTSLVFGLTSRPVTPLQINVRYRSYNADNQTARVTVEGFSPRDYDWLTEGRITAPYSNKNARLDLTAGYTAGLVTIEGGFRQTKIDRTYRETGQTTENAGSIAAILHISEAADIRAVYEKASRDYSDLKPILFRDEQTWVHNPRAGDPPNVLQRDGNLRYDQSQRDSDRVGFDLDLSAGSATTFTVSYLRNYNTYKGTVHGLQDDKYDTVTGEVSITPSERVNLFAYYSYEKNGNNMVSSGNSPFLPVNDYNMLSEDKADSVGLGTTFQVVPDKVTINLSGRYQKVDGNIHFDVDPASANALGRVAYGGVKDPTDVDDTKITRVDASLDYALAPAWTVTAGTWYEDYTISDYMTTGLQNLYPGAFFIAANSGSYHATVGYVRLTYHW